MASPTPAPTPHIPYKILSQEESKQLTADSRLVPVWRVTFEDENHHVGTVEVPDNEYTPAHVDTLIEEKLENMSGVHNLGAQPHPENLAGGSTE